MRKHKKHTLFSVLILFSVVVLFFIVNIKDNEVNNNQQTIVKSNNEENVKTVDVESKYGTLKLPEEFSDKIRVKIVDDKIYTVEFYGMVGDQKELHLIDIQFGENLEGAIGQMFVNDKNVEVGIVYYNLTKEKNLDEDEEMEAQVMQSSIEYVIDMLVEQDGLKLNI